jgi:hypothetical protein
MVAMPGAALLVLLAAGAMRPVILYSMTVLYLSVRRRLDRKEGAFDLGRFEIPVAIGALMWSAVVLFVLISPPSARDSLLIVGACSSWAPSTSSRCSSSTTRCWKPNPAT